MSMSDLMSQSKQFIYRANSKSCLHITRMLLSSTPYPEEAIKSHNLGLGTVILTKIKML